MNNILDPNNINGLIRLLQYLIPENPFSLVVTVFTAAVFLWFLAYPLRSLKKKIKQEKEILFRLKDRAFIETIRYKATQKAPLEEPPGQEDVTEQEEVVVLQFGKAPIDEVLNMEAPSSSLVGRTFRIICTAGIQESRLEVSELINFLEQKLEREIDTLKIILSSFIVLGLLGTLFGLADSFSGLSNIFLRDPQYSDLYMLLSKLRSALAPSIWGIIFTIVSLYFYRSLVWKDYSPFIDQFREVVVSEWVPVLCPTSPQKWIESLEKSSQTMEYAIREITKASQLSYSQFAQSAEELAKNLVKLNKVMDNSVKSASAFEKLSVNLEHGLSNIDEFLRHEQQFMKDYKELVTGVSAEWREQIGYIREQNAQILSLIELEQRNAHELRGVLKENFGQLIETMNTLNVEVPSKLRNIADEIAKLDTPLQASADDIRAIFKSLSTYIETELRPYIEQLISKTDAAQPINELKEALNEKLALIKTPDWKEAPEIHLGKLLRALEEMKKTIILIREKAPARTDTAKVNWGDSGEAAQQAPKEEDKRKSRRKWLPF